MKGRLILLRQILGINLIFIDYTTLFPSTLISMNNIKHPQRSAHQEKCMYLNQFYDNFSLTMHWKSLFNCYNFKIYMRYNWRTEKWNTEHAFDCLLLFLDHIFLNLRYLQYFRIFCTPALLQWTRLWMWLEKKRKTIWSFKAKIFLKNLWKRELCF